MTDLYWWFSRAGGKLGYDDGRVAALGVTHRVEGEVKLCERGLHASLRAIDALQYAPGPVVWRVRLGGEVIHGGDKAVASMREYVGGGIDCSDVLRVAARQFALRVAHLWDCPSVVRRYLEAGDERLRAEAARAAARAAAWAKAGAEAGAEAEAAAAEAAWAAWAAKAAWAEAEAEAGAAWAERNAQNSILEDLLNEKLGG